MARRQTIFVCQSCGATSPKWMGRCPDCSAWSSMVEEAIQATGTRRASSSPAPEPVPLSSVPEDASLRLSTAMPELDRVLGGGLVPGSAVLLGGDPGVGKSTLLLQMLSSLAAQGRRVLYVTAEESLRQVRLRARRVADESDNLLVLAATELPAVKEAIISSAPETVVLDSVQTLYHPDIPSAPGSISQVRQIASETVALGKERSIATWLVGHVTKEGAIAGPRTLEHLVDTVLYFEGETVHAHRIVRAVKNRFGSTNEIALLEMTGSGLVGVDDPSSLFLPAPESVCSGSVAVMGMEGTRPLLVEVQALAAPTPFPNPRRTVSGADLSRLLLILAILEKRVGEHSGALDVFANVAGGLKLTEPAADLGLALAVVSSIREKAVPAGTAMAGELGLSGEVRPVARLESRLREAQRLGFTRALVPAPGRGREAAPRVEGIQAVPVRTLEEAIREALG